MATGGTVAQDLTMPWSTLSGFMQDLTLMVIDEGQQYGTDREIATISLLKQQPLILWTGDAQQTPGGIARTAPDAKRSRQLLLAKKHGLRSDRNYYMPSNLAEAMIRLLDDSSNEGLHLLNQTLRNSEHVLGRVWTEQLSPADEEDLRAGPQSPSGPRLTLPNSTSKRAGTAPDKGRCHAPSKALPSTSRDLSSASPGCYNM